MTVEMIPWRRESEFTQYRAIVAAYMNGLLPEDHREGDVVALGALGECVGVDLDAFCYRGAHFLWRVYCRKKFSAAPRGDCWDAAGAQRETDRFRGYSIAVLDVWALVGRVREVHVYSSHSGAFALAGPWWTTLREDLASVLADGRARRTAAAIARLSG